MSKTIVTHIAPDLDAAGSYWLIKNFLPGWSEADVAFVPAGRTLDDKDPDEDPNIIHVDTGMGRFDHHQTDARTCATQLVFEYLRDNKHIPAKSLPAIERMAAFITDIDHFGEVHFPEPVSDRYEFSLHQFAEGLKPVLKDNKKTVEAICLNLDAIYVIFRNKVKAEEEIQKGLIVKTKWGKTLIMESKVEEAVKLALKSGFDMVIRKNPDNGYLRIKTYPSKEFDLTPLYEKLIGLDPKATWYLHSSKNMLLNGSAKTPNATPTKLTFQNVIEIVKKIK